MTIGGFPKIRESTGRFQWRLSHIEWFTEFGLQVALVGCPRTPETNLTRTTTKKTLLTYKFIIVKNLVITVLKLGLEWRIILSRQFSIFSFLLEPVPAIAHGPTIYTIPPPNYGLKKSEQICVKFSSCQFLIYVKCKLNYHIKYEFFHSLQEKWKDGSVINQYRHLVHELS